MQVHILKLKKNAGTTPFISSETGTVTMGNKLCSFDNPKSSRVDSLDFRRTMDINSRTHFEARSIKPQNDTSGPENRRTHINIIM